MILSYLHILLLLCSCISAFAMAEPNHYVVEARAVSPGRVGDYYASLLNMILHASKKPNEVIDLQFSDRQFTQARWIAEVQSGQHNEIMWTTTSRQREQMLLPIRVPVFKGLLGQRILIIRRKDQAIFSSLKTKNDFMALIAGQHIHWSDTDILRANHLPVTTGGGKENLYKMLEAGRFDYFPRGIIEIASEANFIRDNNLMLDEHVIISYPMPIYFFVNKNNTELAQRLEKGWDIIIRNGSFDEFFFGHPRVKVALDELRKHKRTVIKLDNPFLPDETPLDRRDYWYDVSNP